MLGNEARNLLVNAYETKCSNAKQLANIFDVKERTVYRLVAQKRTTGSVELRTSERGRKPQLNEEQVHQVDELLKQKPDITLQGIIEELDLDCSVSTLSRTVRFKLGYSLKKKVIHASEQERPDVKEKRTNWQEFASEVNQENLVFLDESGINTNMTRRYGRSVGKTRVVDKVPCNTPQNTTVISSIRLDGTHAYDVIEGAMNTECFIEYIKNTLIPTLKIGDIVIMDNLKVHKACAVSELISSVGATVMFLPPYSPDFNPIEKMWSKMKTYLRKWKIRTKNLLANAVKNALDLVTPSDCEGWYFCCGYC